MPCDELWELWPKLEELKVHVRACTEIQNYDTQFCGISEEEAEELRGVNEEHLRNVQIVPIQPSVMTMRSEY